MSLICRVLEHCEARNLCAFYTINDEKIKLERNEEKQSGG